MTGATCLDIRTPGVVCPYHRHRLYGRNDCWNLRDEHGEHLPSSFDGDLEVDAP